MRLTRVAVIGMLVLGPLPAQAAGLCTAPSKKAPPVGSTPCEGVRPGATYVSGAETCTMGFVFAGSDRRRYVATAGHCAFAPDPATDPGATKTWKAGTGPVVKNADGKQLGRFAYATMKGTWGDFALIRLDNGVAASPQMCHFGGPTSLTTAVHGDAVQVHHYGNGTGPDGVPARTGVAALGLYRADYAFFHGVAAPGDSGSPVIDENGAAVGILTDLTTPFTGNVGVNRMAHHLADASRLLRIKLTLLTAPEL